jgi:hypothetical protein
MTTEIFGTLVLFTFDNRLHAARRREMALEAKSRMIEASSVSTHSLRPVKVQIR